MIRVSLTVFLTSANLIACREPPAMLLPSTSEPLALSIQPNHTGAGDRIPSVRISGGSGSVTMVLTQRWICGGHVSAGVSRAAGDLAIVVRQILPDSAVACAMSIAVLDYTGTIAGLSSGSYRVRVFEVHRDRSRIIGSSTVPVTAVAIQARQSGEWRAALLVWLSQLS